jgi:hypothetical protein
MKRLIVACVVATFLLLMSAYAFQIDMGDLPQCGYPTLFANPGNSLSGIAWLGDTITAETSPHAVGQDLGDDGVTFLNQNLGWTPCTVESVQVVVTGGPNYPAHAAQGGKLYLNAWKDGNLNGDFCDILCNGQAPEWIIQDVLVTPGTAIYRFIDPGISDSGVYRGIFRFRLTRKPHGQYGFGMRDITGQCSEWCAPPDSGFALDTCGEVEDYVIGDLQLAVNLLGDVVATAGDEKVTLSWATGSETDNDRFEIVRDGRMIGHVSGVGTSPSRHDYTWSEEGLNNGMTYTYTLRSVDLNGQAHDLATVSATPSFGAGEVTEYALHQNYPNPFNPSTQIVFDLKDDSWVQLRVYDVLGRNVASLVDAPMTRGRHTATFDGAALPSGLYVCRISTGGFADEIKMLLLK